MFERLADIIVHRIGGPWPLARRISEYIGHVEADAFEILKKLPGRPHKVITGCAVIGKNGEKSFSQITEVDFYTMSDDEILDYIKTGEPMDKAGAYGIQGFAARFIKEIRGDYFNVVGLPVSMLYRALRKNDHIKN